MTRKQSLQLAIASAVFGLGSLLYARPAEASSACSGKERICSGTCGIVCDPKDKNTCFYACQLTMPEAE